jgi:hypothetical protein
MMNMRIRATALLSSLALHAFGGVCLYAAGLTAGSAPSDQAITISYVRPQVEIQVKETPREQAIEKKAPVPESSTAAVSAKKRLDPIRKTSDDTAGISARKPTSTARPKAAASALPKTGTDFMTDPQNGKFYVTYFAVIKEKVHKTLRRKYIQGQPAQGKVSLIFVLDSNGALAQAGVNTKESSASEFLKDFALSCLKASVPFRPFPRELNAEQISFTVTVYFEEI